MGSKTLPDQGRQVSASPGLEAFFVALGLGYCTSAEAEKQVVFSSQAYQFLTRLYKEYSLERGGVSSPAQGQQRPAAVRSTE